MPSVAALDFVRPAFVSVPAAYSHEGGREAIELAAKSGLILDPWQAWVIEQALAENDDGSSAAFEVAVVVPRQNGKGTILEALTLAWLFLCDVELVLWSAHEFKTAQEAFRRMRMLLQGAPDLWSLIGPGGITTAKGNEAIELLTGQRLKFVARSESSGRGFTGDKIILDEAYDLNADEIAAMLPTLTTVQDPQIIYTSSAGRGDSDILRAVRDRGRSGSDPSLCWLEWCAPEDSCRLGEACRHTFGTDGCALDREDFRQLSNPALGGRFPASRMAKFRRAMPSAEFGREYLGWWDPPVGGEQPIDLVAWSQLAKNRKSPRRVAPVFFVDVSPGMRSAAIAVAFDSKTPHVELVDDGYGPGTDWLVPRLKRLLKNHKSATWAVERQGAIGALLPELAEAGIEIADDHQFTAGDMGRACGYLQKLVADKAMTHTDDPLFSTALAGAVKRDVGEGLWAWGRRKSTTDLSPLVAVTGAAWALELFGAYDLLDSVL